MGVKRVRRVMACSMFAVGVAAFSAMAVDSDKAKAQSAPALTCVEQGEGGIIAAFVPRESADGRIVDVDLKTAGGIPIMRIDNSGDETDTITVQIPGNPDIELTGLPNGSNFVPLTDLGAVSSQTFLKELLVNGAPSGAGGGTATYGGGVTTDLEDIGSPVFPNGVLCGRPMDGPIEVFMQRRLDNLLTYGPDRARLLRRLDEDRGGAVSMKDGGLKDGPVSSYTTRTGIDLWIEAQGSVFDDEDDVLDREGDFRVVYVGVDKVVTTGVLVGFLAQFDWSDEDFTDADGNTGDIDGTGWMVGPYAAVRLSEHLMLNGRFAYGQSENDISLTEELFGTRTGDFDTDRWIATAELTGLWHIDGMRFSPSVGVEYGNEDQDSFVNSFGETVASNDVELGRVTFGTEIGTKIMHADGSSIEPHASIEGIWTFEGDEDVVIDGVATGVDEFRGKAEAGVILRSADGYALRAAASYDGLGDDDYEAWGGSVWFNIPLN